MFLRLAVGMVALGLVSLAGFAACAWRPALAEVETPSPSSFAPDVVARGATLAAAGYCSTCHTVPGLRAAQNAADPLRIEGRLGRRLRGQASEWIFAELVLDDPSGTVPGWVM